MSTHRKLAVLVLLVASCACAHNAAVAVPGEGECPLSIAVSDRYDNAGLFKPTFRPSSLEAIEVSDGGDGFHIVPVDRDKPLLPPSTVKSASWPRRSHRWLLSWGVPTDAWVRVGRKVEAYTYEVQPGTYQLVVKYRAVGSSRMCVAASPPFTIAKPSLWVGAD